MAQNQGGGAGFANNSKNNNGGQDTNNNSNNYQNALHEMRQQIEYYFSSSNLPTDAYLQTSLATYAGSVPLSTISHFRRLQQCYESAGGGGGGNRGESIEQMIIRAAQSSHLVMVSEDGRFLRPLALPDLGAAAPPPVNNNNNQHANGNNNYYHQHGGNMVSPDQRTITPTSFATSDSNASYYNGSEGGQPQQQASYNFTSVYQPDAYHPAMPPPPPPSLLQQQQQVLHHPPTTMTHPQASLLPPAPPQHHPVSVPEGGSSGRYHHHQEGHAGNLSPLRKPEGRRPLAYAPVAAPAAYHPPPTNHERHGIMVNAYSEVHNDGHQYPGFAQQQNGNHHQYPVQQQQQQQQQMATAYPGSLYGNVHQGIAVDAPCFQQGYASSPPPIYGHLGQQLYPPTPYPSPYADDSSTYYYPPSDSTGPPLYVSSNHHYENHHPDDGSSISSNFQESAIVQHPDHDDPQGFPREDPPPFQGRKNKGGYNKKKNHRFENKHQHRHHDNQHQHRRCHQEQQVPDRHMQEQQPQQPMTPRRENRSKNGFRVNKQKWRESKPLLSDARQFPVLPAANEIEIKAAKVDERSALPHPSQPESATTANSGTGGEKQLSQSSKLKNGRKKKYAEALMANPAPAIDKAPKASEKAGTGGSDNAAKQNGDEKASSSAAVEKLGQKISEMSAQSW